MKKLLFILPVFFFTVAVNAQQTEDEVYIGKKYGNFKGIGIIIPDFDRKGKTTDDGKTVTGTVVSVGKLVCLGNKCTATSITVKKDDGTIVIIGTKDFDFKLPGGIKGRKIIVEGVEPDKLPVKEEL